MMFPNWDWTLIAVSASFHGVAIFSTIFRFWYRWCTGLLWWDDAWAALAFLADIAFLVATLIEQPIPHDIFPRFFTVGNWIVSFAYPALMWPARISILISMMRVSRPEGMLRHISTGTGILFGLIATGMSALRIQLCVTRACLITRTFLIIQTTVDCIADVLLSALPIWSLSQMNLGRRRKILISSVFSASMVISVVTVIQTVACFQSITSGSIVFEHVKVACAMIVCNLLVIVTFVYRVWHKGKKRLEDSVPDLNENVFTTIDLAQMEFSEDVTKGRSSTWSFGGSRSTTALGSRIFVEPEGNGEANKSGLSCPC